MITKLIYQDESSNKFWNIEVAGNTHTVTYGRVGSNGSSKTKSFADADAALHDANKLVASKKRKGYQEAAQKAMVIRDSFTFAGKPIKDFASNFNPETAVKIVGQAYVEEGKPTVLDQIDKLVKLSNIAELDTLVIGPWEEAYETNCDPILNKLIEHKTSLSGLRHLFVGDMGMEDCEISWINQSDYSNFYSHFPALESFGVKGGQDLRLGQINLPNLKNLIIETGGLDRSVIQGINHSNLPKLEYLDIWLGTDDYGGTVKVDDLMPILNGRFPKIKFLGLKNYDLEDEVALGLLAAPVLANLEVLDMSMGVLKDAGAEALYNNDALLKLKHINCRHHFISKDWQAKLKEKFVAQNINLNDAQEAEDDDWFFVEIGE